MSTFCKDCAHISGSFGYYECEVTRRHYVDGVSGKPWSCADSCSYARSEDASGNCRKFEPKPTLIQKLKEVFK